MVWRVCLVTGHWSKVCDSFPENHLHKMYLISLRVQWRVISDEANMQQLSRKKLTPARADLGSRIRYSRTSASTWRGDQHESDQSVTSGNYRKLRVVSVGSTNYLLTIFQCRSKAIIVPVSMARGSLSPRVTTVTRSRIRIALHSRFKGPARRVSRPLLALEPPTSTMLGSKAEKNICNFNECVVANASLSVCAASTRCEIDWCWCWLSG